MEALKGLIANGDPKAIAAATKMLPAGEMRTVFEEVFLTQDEQVPEAAPAMPTGPPPDVTTVMSRLTPGGGSGGLQTVGRVA